MLCLIFSFFFIYGFCFCFCFRLFVCFLFVLCFPTPEKCYSKVSIYFPSINWVRRNHLQHRKGNFKSANLKDQRSVSTSYKNPVPGIRTLLYEVLCTKTRHLSNDEGLILFAPPAPIIAHASGPVNMSPEALSTKTTSFLSEFFLAS